MTGMVGRRSRADRSAAPDGGSGCRAVAEITARHGLPTYVKAGPPRSGLPLVFGVRGSPDQGCRRPPGRVGRGRCP